MILYAVIYIINRWGKCDIKCNESLYFILDENRWLVLRAGSEILGFAL